MRFDYDDTWNVQMRQVFPNKEEEGGKKDTKEVGDDIFERGARGTLEADPATNGKGGEGLEGDAPAA